MSKAVLTSNVKPTKKTVNGLIFMMNLANDINSKPHERIPSVTMSDGDYLAQAFKKCGVEMRK